MRILTLLALLTLLLPSCEKEQETKFEEASEPASFAPAKGATTPKPASSEGGLLGKTEAAAACDAACKKACERFSTVQSACEAAYLAGCFESPRNVDESKCQVPTADDGDSVIAGGEREERAAEKKPERDGAALPKLFGDP